MPDSRRDEDSRLRWLADEQAALRRVATLVARGVTEDELLSAVSNEVGQLFGTGQAAIGRYEPDGAHVVYVGISQGLSMIPIGTRWPLEDFLATTTVYRTGRPARQEQRDYEKASGQVADTLRELNTVSRVGAPIFVEGKLWGVLLVTDTQKRLPPDTEECLGTFTELVAAAIANAESRAELASSEAEAQDLAREQAALRRVATLVAEGARSDELFSAVSDEVGRLFGAEAAIARFEAGGSGMVVVGLTSGIPIVSIGTHWPLEDFLASTTVYRTGQPARNDHTGHRNSSGEVADSLRQMNYVSTVAAPITVEGRLWGVMTVSDQCDPLPPDTEERVAKFTELIATAIANADGRAELAASRARVIAASDDARRRIERDLHDGAQQRLVTLSVALRTFETTLPAGSGEQRAEIAQIADDLGAALLELRELSRGIHPAVLTQGGLTPALKALRRRSPVPVTLDIRFEGRLPDQVEVAAYYTVSEALTNTSKHANATGVSVTVELTEEVLHLSIRDDGVGGADRSRGSGLTGLKDRIEALGGRIDFDSPPGSGTEIAVEIPTRANVPGGADSPLTSST